jgi:hypothetical protein
MIESLNHPHPFIAMVHWVLNQAPEPPKITATIHRDAEKMALELPLREAGDEARPLPGERPAGIYAKSQLVD